jgi:fructose/tagatose bisphosphate aldolase
VASTFRAENAVNKSAKEINEAAGVPLTLQGGSGADDEDSRRAVAADIRTIHIDKQYGNGKAQHVA